MKNIAVLATTLKKFENTVESDLVFEQIKDLLIAESEKEGVCLSLIPARGFETMVSMAFLNLRREHNLMLECVIPYEEFAAEWDEADRDRYFYIMEKCDKETLMQSRFTPDAEQKSIEYIVSVADEIITYGELPLKARTIVASSGKKVLKL